jgi:hypothetical protein
MKDKALNLILFLWNKKAAGPYGVVWQLHAKEANERLVLRKDQRCGRIG